MKEIKQISTADLVFSMRKLSDAAREVAWARSPAEAEYLTLNFLRPRVTEIEKLLEDIKSERKTRIPLE